MTFAQAASDLSATLTYEDHERSRRTNNTIGSPQHVPGQLHWHKSAVQFHGGHGRRKDFF